MTQFNSPSPDCNCFFPGHSHWERPREPSLIAGVREELLRIREPADDSAMTPHRQWQTPPPPRLHLSMLPHDRNVGWKGAPEVSHSSNLPLKTGLSPASDQVIHGFGWRSLEKSPGVEIPPPLWVSFIPILVILFLGIYPSSKQLSPTSRAITSGCFTIHNSCPLRTWWPRYKQEAEHLLWEH